jgi:beta-glucosidase
MEIPFFRGHMSKILLALLLAGSSSFIDKDTKPTDHDFFNQKHTVLEFPQGFLKGVARSFYQDGGHHAWSSRDKKTESNWQWFENHSIRCSVKGVSLFSRSPIKNGQMIDNASDGWNRAFEDIALLEQLGCNAQRFSVEWAEIEPEEGVFNTQALQFYKQYCKALIEKNITPMITLHHFVHPLWFERKGGFTQEENIHYFVEFAQKVFSELGADVHLWCTINEPTVLGACGYILGIHPPAKLGKVYTAGLVLKHLLQTHVEVYKVLKGMPHGQEAQIGLVHQLLLFEPYKYLMPFGLQLQNPLGALTANIFNFSFAHDTVKQFLTTGEFNYKPFPLLAGIEYSCPEAVRSYDFIGLNFYSKVVIGMGPTHYADQVMTDMDYAMRPAALYDAIKEMSHLGVPLYITETGIADARDDRRESFIKSYMGAIYQAVLEGVDLRGVFYWSLMDNYEWNDGFDMKFGLFSVDPTTKERVLRAGSYAYRDYVKIKANEAGAIDLC